MCKIAMLSVHGCPLARLGTNEAGGMQLYVRALSRELGRRGMSVDVFTRRTDPSLPEIVPFGTNARVIHVDAGPAEPIDKNAVVDVLPEFVCNLQRFRRAEQIEYDIIHSHYWLSGWVGNLLSPRWGVPHLTMFHTLGRLKNKALSGQGETDARIDVEGRIVNSASRIIASSEHERQALVDLYGGRRDRIAVIPCGVDLELFSPLDSDVARQKLGLSGNVILYVGRMDPVKGLDVLLGSMALLKDRRDTTLVIVGGSGREDEMRRNQNLAVNLGLNGRVIFRGAVPQEQLPSYYSAATICVVPSHYESFGLVAIEALACGTPVVGSMVGGLPTVVHERENGLLVPWRRPEAFAESIARILDDPSLRRHLSTRARGSVLRYGWGHVAEQVVELYHESTVQHEHLRACFEGVGCH